MDYIIFYSVLKFERYLLPFLFDPVFFGILKKYIALFWKKKKHFFEKCETTNVFDVYRLKFLSTMATPLFKLKMNQN